MSLLITRGLGIGGETGGGDVYHIPPLSVEVPEYGGLTVMTGSSGLSVQMEEYNVTNTTVSGKTLTTTIADRRLRVIIGGCS